jgi:hypothetical protein
MRTFDASAPKTAFLTLVTAEVRRFASTPSSVLATATVIGMRRASSAIEPRC